MYLAFSRLKSADGISTSLVTQRGYAYCLYSFCLFQAPQIAKSLLAYFFVIDLLLDFCLVETIYYGVVASGNMDSLDLSFQN